MTDTNQANKPLLITGIERSGSSLMARIMDMCGAFTGPTTSMCENKKIKRYVDNYYDGIHADRKGQYPLPNIKRLRENPCWGSRIADLIGEDGYNGTALWMYKSSRIGQLYPLWHRSFPSAKWLIVRRRSADVIRSCMQTGFMTEYGNSYVQKKVHVSNERDGWRWWIHKHEELYRSMIDGGLNCMQIYPERMMDGDYGQLQEVLEWVGLPWNDKIPSFLNEMLKKVEEVQ